MQVLAAVFADHPNTAELARRPKVPSTTSNDQHRLRMSARGIGMSGPGRLYDRACEFGLSIDARAAFGGDQTEQRPRERLERL